MHHSYDSITDEHIGRWYTSNVNDDKFKLDGVKRQFTYTIPLYEVWDTNKLIKNVKVEIFFTEKGWAKFTDVFH